MQAERFDEAIGIYEELVAARPADAGLLMNLGMARLHGRAGRRQAIAPLEKAARLQPSLAPASLFLGASLLEVGRVKEAAAPAPARGGRAARQCRRPRDARARQAVALRLRERGHALPCAHEGRSEGSEGVVRACAQLPGHRGRGVRRAAATGPRFAAARAARRRGCRDRRQVPGRAPHLPARARRLPACRRRARGDRGPLPARREAGVGGTGAAEGAAARPPPDAPHGGPSACSSKASFARRSSPRAR